MVERTDEMTPTGGYVSVASFGQDGLGELYVIDLDGGRVFRIVSATSNVPEIQDQPFLAQNIPNPFNPQTEIAFAVKTAGSRVSLMVFDAAGHLVRTLVDGTLPAGDHMAVWNGTNNTGARVESGVYLYRLDVNGVAVSRKMLLLE